MVGSEHDDAVRGDGDARRLAHAMHRPAIGIDATRVALGPRIGGVIIDVAAEHFVPVAWPGEAERVAVIREGPFTEADDHNHIPPHAGEPAMVGEHAVAVVDVVHVYGLGPRWHAIYRKSTSVHSVLMRRPQIWPYGVVP